MRDESYYKEMESAFSELLLFVDDLADQFPDKELLAKLYAKYREKGGEATGNRMKFKAIVYDRAIRPVRINAKVSVSASRHLTELLEKYRHDYPERQWTMTDMLEIALQQLHRKKLRD